MTHSRTPSKRHRTGSETRSRAVPPAGLSPAPGQPKKRTPPCAQDALSQGDILAHVALVFVFTTSPVSASNAGSGNICRPAGFEYRHPNTRLTTSEPHIDRLPARRPGHYASLLGVGPPPPATGCCIDLRWLYDAATRSNASAPCGKNCA